MQDSREHIISKCNPEPRCADYIKNAYMQHQTLTALFIIATKATDSSFIDTAHKLDDFRFHYVVVMR